MVAGTTQDEMRDLWSQALGRASIRKNVVKQSKTLQIAADPGELKSDKGYHNWNQRWENYLSTIPGQNGVPLSYVIRIKSAPKFDPETPYLTFIDRMIRCAPRSGPACVSGRRKLHQLYVSHLGTTMKG